MTPLALIPARAGSTRLPGKNRMEVGGEPLWLRAVHCAHDAGIEHIVVATDDPEILGYAGAARCGYELFIRKAADDQQTTEELVDEWFVDDGAQRCDWDALVLLQPTSPLRTADHLREALEIMRGGVVVHTLPTGVEVADAPDSLVSVDGTFGMANGAIYIVTLDAYCRHDALVCGRIMTYRMAHRASVDVNTQEDLDNARRWHDAERMT